MDSKWNVVSMICILYYVFEKTCSPQQSNCWMYYMKKKLQTVKGVVHSFHRQFSHIILISYITTLHSETSSTHLRSFHYLSPNLLQYTSNALSLKTRNSWLFGWFVEVYLWYYDFIHVTQICINTLNVCSPFLLVYILTGNMPSMLASVDLDLFSLA